MQQPIKLEFLPTYFGGKAAEGTIHTLINQIPPHTRFISAFLGNCAVMRHKRPALLNVGVELDLQVFGAWRAAKLPWLHLINGDAFDLLTELKAERELDRSTFLFLDPPYLEGTTRNRIRYNHLFTYDQHVAMLELIRGLPCNVMLCALPNVLNDNMLPGWRCLQYRNQTRRGVQVEQLWMNYEKPERLHDTRFVGDTFRERERIQRRARSYERQLAQLPPTERQRIVEHLASTFA